MTRELIKTDRNGTKHWNTLVPCDRCGGTGIYRWGAIQTDHNGHVIGSTYAGVCFKCNGAAKVWEIVKEYTPEYRAKLDAANEKRRAKKRAEWEKARAEREAELAKKRAEEAAERARREAERLAEIERNRGHFIGEVGDKIELEVTFVRSFNYETRHPAFDWKTISISGYVFKTDDGNTLVYKTGSIFGKKEFRPDGHFRDNEKDGWYDWVHPEEGSRLKIKGTIKAHEEFNNVNQTILTRAKWVE